MALKLVQTPLWHMVGNLQASQALYKKFSEAERVGRSVWVGLSPQIIPGFSLMPAVDDISLYITLACFVISVTSWLTRRTNGPIPSLS